MNAISEDFWAGRKVLVTGHTGFKGAWLSLWLHSLGAQVTGYSLPPPTTPSLFESCRLQRLIRTVTGDVRDREALRRVVQEDCFDVVIHLAAQPLVRRSYLDPVETYSTNVMGTVSLLEAVRAADSVKAVVVVTSDKCYENREWPWGYRENEPMGGLDPYSSSKGCAELVVQAYRHSFFHPEAYGTHGKAIATARSGNVIGAGDWADDRLVPDCVRALLKGEKIRVRSPRSIRPWLYVLDSLSGYLALAETLHREGPAFGEAWNFGPAATEARSVEWVVQTLCALWGEGALYELDQASHPHEARALALDSTRSGTRLGWSPRVPLHEALDAIVRWTRVYRGERDMRDDSLALLTDYQKAR